jgi:WD40 repeat protein
VNVKHVVLAVHGIRTFGQWTDRLRALVGAKNPDIVFLTYSYGYFSALAFLLPPFRWVAIFWFRRELQALARDYPGARVDIVCHSFGTHLVGWGLRSSRRSTLPRIHTVIMAGSVLRRRFRWGSILRDYRVHRVVNDCGLHDAALIASQLFVLFTGMAGRVGFVGVVGERLVNRFHSGGHGLYFNDTFMQTFWVPLIVSDQAPLRHDERDANATVLSGLWLSGLQNFEVIKLFVYVVLPAYLVSSYLHERHIATAVMLAAQAEAMLSTSGDHNIPGLLLALESNKRSPTENGRRALERALAMLPRPRAVLRLTTPVRHFSLDYEGGSLLVGTEDGKAIVLDTDTMRPGVGVGSEQPTIVVAISGDGTRSYAAHALGGGSMWDTKTGQRLVQIPFEGEILAAAFTADSAQLMTVSRANSQDGAELRSWRASDGRLLSTDALESAPVTAVALSPGATLVATAREAPSSLDEGIRVWDTHTKKEVARFQSSSTVTSIALSANTPRIAIGDQLGRIRVLSTRGGNIADMQVTGPITHLAFGRYEADRASPASFNLKELESDDSFQRALDQGLSLVPPGLFLASVANGKTVTVWEADTGRWVSSMVHEDVVNDVLFGPKDHTILTASGERVSVWHGLPEHFDLMRLDGSVKALAFGLKANSLIALDENGIYRAWNRETGRGIAQFELFMSSQTMRPHFHSARFVVTPAAILIAGATEFDPSVLYFWEATTGQPLGKASFDAAVEALAVSSNGTTVVAGLDDGTIHVLETSDQSKVGEFRTGQAITSVALSADGKWIVTASDDRMIRLWSSESNQEILRFPHPSKITSLLVNTGHKWIIVADETGSVSVIDGVRGGSVLHLSRQGKITSLALGDEHLLALGGTHVEVIDLPSGRVLADQAAAEGVDELLFSPDAQRLFVASKGVITPWLWDLPALIADGCTRATRNLTSAEWDAFFAGESYRATCPMLKQPGESGVK